MTSQHAITTQHIIIAEDGASAHAISYFTGIHFGQGKWKGHDVTAYGQYKDTLRCDKTLAPTAAGAAGRWLITERYVSFFGRRGEEGVMEAGDPKP